MSRPRPQRSAPAPEGATLSDLLTSKIPPHSIPDERALFAYALSPVGGVEHPVIRAFLGAGEAVCYKETHRQLHRAIADQATAGTKPTVRSVADAIDADRLEELGGMPALVQMVADEAPEASSLAGIWRVVQEHAARREAIRQGTEIVGRAYEGAPPEELTRTAESLLVTVSSSASDWTPNVRRYGEDLEVTWPAFTDLVLKMDNAEMSTDGAFVIARVERQDGRTVMAPLRLNLYSGQGRDSLVKKLRGVASSCPWAEVVEATVAACGKAIASNIAGVELDMDAPLKHSKDLVEGVVPHEQVGLMIADGGVGKSTNSFLPLLAVSSGRSVAGLFHPRDQGPVEIWDWEADEETATGLFSRLARGQGLRVKPREFFYRRMRYPLPVIARELAREVAKRGTKFVVVDSLGMASAAPDVAPESAQAAIALGVALRRFEGVSFLGLHHVSKVAADAAGPARPFGSVFARNIPRIVSELVLADTADHERQYILRCTKRNNDIEPQPMTYRLIYEPHKGPIRVETASITQATTGLEKLSGMQRVRALLTESGIALTVEAVAEQTGIDVKVARIYLERLDRSKFAVRTQDRGGPVRYAVRASRREPS